MIRRGKYRAEKVAYPDGVGCCLWRLFPGSKDEDTGTCFDFAFDELEDIIGCLEALRDAPVEPYEPEQCD